MVSIVNLWKPSGVEANELNPKGPLESNAVNGKEDKEREEIDGVEKEEWVDLSKTDNERARIFEWFKKWEGLWVKEEGHKEERFFSFVKLLNDKYLLKFIIFYNEFFLKNSKNRTEKSKIPLQFFFPWYVIFSTKLSIHK